MDVAALAGRLRALAADLPASAVDTADAHLERAAAGLEEAGRESNAEIGRDLFGHARIRLARARAGLAAAAGAVDDYLDAIGAGRAHGGPGPARPVTAAPAPVHPDQWWTDRINALCRRTGAARPDRPAPTRLFNDLLRDAAGADPAAYHRRLRDAGPETGVKLAALAWPLVRSLASEHLGRTPAARDVPVLRGRTADAVRALVPGAENDHLDTALAAACTLTGTGADRADAAATAAIGPALVAALHRLPRRARQART
ncbi:hypothetical protein GCM10027447_35770 [Glycomyces halotolerans]